MSMHGLILLDKASGLSSAAAIAQVKRKLGCEKIGHAGTLDPAATGLLVCLVGNATKLASLVEGGVKHYSGLIKLGVTTSSDDLDGEIISQKPVSFRAEDLSEVERKFTGEISQLPPAISAIKIDGERSYKRARRGEEVKHSPRLITILSLTLKKITHDEISYDTICTKGTYVRSLARDIGESLGCGAAVKTLRREGSYPFEVKDAKSIEELNSSDLMPLSALFPEERRLLLESELAALLRSGNPAALKRIPSESKGKLRENELFLYFDKKDIASPKGVLCYLQDSWKIAMNF